MKTFFVTLLLSMAITAHAAPVDGKIVYQLPSGEIVDREVRLDVPPRGIGEVILSGEKFEWRTENFWTVKKAGQEKFYAVFKAEFMGMKSTILFKGTYIRGTNKILYYGDFYKQKGFHDITQANGLRNFTFKGGFKFEYIR